MSLQHFFLEEQIIEGGCFTLNLSDEDLHHAKVLRLAPGEHIGVIDAKGIYFECEILDYDFNVRVCKRDKHIDNFSITLCPGLAKGSKLDDVIKSCTEIGVNDFYPISFERCVVKLDNNKSQKRERRWQKIAKSAAMQSGRYSIPFVHHIQNNFDFLKKYDAVYLFWEEADNLDFIHEIKHKNIAIVIGPEGGITNNEVDKIKSINKNTYVASLGSNILRTETANIVATTLIKFNHV
ncbi:MAG: RsmE family RNA methyltransferase [Coriobacteriia bacterium]|nr:RsmE family RNA methyltransferase [Coriobacteriia bacterium]